MFSTQRIKQSFGWTNVYTIRTLRVDSLMLDFGNEHALISDSQILVLLADFLLLDVNLHSYVDHKG
jgi:hypothetical protein